MLKKLLKYDIKNMYKFLIIFYILALFFSITTRIIYSLDKTVVVDIIGGISNGCMIAMLVNILINTLIRNWVRFNESIYKDESYLTHTLPITKKELLSSKLILSFLTLLSSFIVIILSLLITYYTKEKFILLKDYLVNISEFMNINSTYLIIFLLVILFVEMYSLLISGFLGIILGNKKNNNKTLHSLISSFIIYNISQLIILLMTFILGLINPDVMKLFTSSTIPDNVIKLILPFETIIYVIIICINSYISRKCLEKGVNVL